MCNTVSPLNKKERDSQTERKQRERVKKRQKENEAEKQVGEIYRLLKINLKIIPEKA